MWLAATRSPRPTRVPARRRRDVAPEPLESRALLTAVGSPLQFVVFDQTAVAGRQQTFALGNTWPYAPDAVQDATVDWGDGSASPATATPGGIAGFTLSGNHTYAAPGVYHVAVHMLAHQLEGPYATGPVVPEEIGLDVTASPAFITPKPGRDLLALQGVPIQVGSIGNGFDYPGSLATFTTNIPDPQSNTAVMIDWGDGSAPTPGLLPSTINIDPNSGLNPARIVASHTFAAAGQYTVTITIQGAGATASTTLGADVRSSPVAFLTNGETFGGTAGIGSTLPIRWVDLSDPEKRWWLGGTGSFNPAADARYRATVDWGDGSAPEGVTVFDDGQIGSTHAYAAPGTYRVTATLTRDDGQATSAVNTIVIAAESVAIDPATFTVIAGQETAVKVASVRQGPTSAGLGDSMFGPRGTVYRSLEFAIDWGDGTAPDHVRSFFPETSPNPDDVTKDHLAGVGAKLFDLARAHRYAQAGVYNVRITATSEATGATYAADGVANVQAFATSAIPISGVEGTPVGGDGLAIAAIPGGLTSPGDYRATIDWGDGSAPEAGAIALRTVTDAQGSHVEVVVKGLHAYAAGTYHALVTITDAQGRSVTVGPAVTIAAKPPEGSAPQDDGSAPTAVSGHYALVYRYGHPDQTHRAWITDAVVSAARKRGHVAVVAHGPKGHLHVRRAHPHRAR